MIKNLNDIVKAAQKQSKMRLVVAAAEDKDVLQAVAEAQSKKIIEAILIGDQNKITAMAKALEVDLSSFTVIHMPDLMEAALEAVKMVSTGKADFVMKGILDTSILLKAVLDKEVGLRTENLLSHVMVYEVPTYHKLLFLTDGGMNITPTLEEKKSILKNAIVSAKATGVQKIKVACLAAKEKVSNKMQATVDAEALKELAKKDYFGKGAIVEGPISFDLAVSKDAAKIKGFSSPVAGDADILLVPTIEVGNGIGKALTYMAKAKSAGIIMGAKAPVVLVSRADDAETKLYSIALGSVIAASNK
ncbi:bifunctional enoyl-CoA hydratase/phosphate acetyltransferase [Clostridium formicaceticum]|uniref:Phosphate acetyltransferase n=1 Tax=Clostridium formicaceticum TaxID=1497 RepID=A0AAC9RIV1_9CLOT|nr:bifunctional enoyl-CoA hydratase/phosphate acetyltransferase [Clostridium formicaceticum]AOY76462.1 phosphate butyryltransferase [Clostridium formicaceticum]ARE86861.1 Phosphate acetyltransferase [Clostridium formicaceticum]